MKTFKTFVIALCSFLAVSLTTQAQTVPAENSFGIRASINSTQGTLLVPIMLTSELSVAPYIGFTAIENQSTNFNIGVSPRYYLGGSNGITTYATGNLGINTTSFSNTNSSVTDAQLGVGYGAEYFFNDSFSISADGNLNARFGNSATRVSTSAVVSASFYF